MTDKVSAAAAAAAAAEAAEAADFVADLRSQALTSYKLKNLTEAEWKFRQALAIMDGRFTLPVVICPVGFCNLSLVCGQISNGVLVF